MVNRRRAKGRSENGSFIAIPHVVLRSQAYASLTLPERALLLDLAGLYRYGSNGAITATWTVMRALGWRSRDTLRRALTGLQAAGFIELCRQGGRHFPSLYALTWLSIDACGGRLDCPPQVIASHRYRTEKQNGGTGNVSIRRRQENKTVARGACHIDPGAVSHRPGSRVDSVAADPGAVSVAPIHVIESTREPCRSTYLPGRHRQVSSVRRAHKGHHPARHWSALSAVRRPQPFRLAARMNLRARHRRAPVGSGGP